MPDKIITDQPQAKRRLIQAVSATTFQTILEAPLFSVPLTDEDVAVIDPDDDERELRPGEVFLATGIVIANVTSTARTVEVEMVGEDGTATSLAPLVTVPANDVLTLPPGLSVFKFDLSDPDAAGGRLRWRASAAGALTLTMAVVEREALDHAPDTEGA